jgi:ankyrin repeat protein
MLFFRNQENAASRKRLRDSTEGVEIMTSQPTAEQRADATRKLECAYLHMDYHELLETLSNGANPNTKIADSGVSLLDHAEKTSWSGAIAALLEHDAAATRGRVLSLADVEDVDGYFTIHQAVASGFQKALARLIEAGADIEVPNTYDGFTPLLTAVQCNKEALARTLLDAGANVDGRGLTLHTPLYEACVLGHHQLVRMLLDAGADMDARVGVDLDDDDPETDNNGMIIFELADWCGDEIRALLYHHRGLLDATRSAHAQELSLPSATNRSRERL